MTQNSQPLPLEEALARLFELVDPVKGIQFAALNQALHRVLATPAYAPINLPPFPASAMDGYALREQDLRASPTGEFNIVGQSLAGHPSTATVGPGECVRIFTGAQVPDGADWIVLQEEVAIATDRQVQFRAHSQNESYVRPIGHDVHEGQPMAMAGTTISPLISGSLTAAGINQIELVRRPVVGVFSTGDELVDPQTPADQLKPGQIYDSNRATVLNLLRSGRYQLEDLGCLADDENEVTQALKQASKRCDIMITSGGVSVGDADFVTSAIEQLGTLEFWRLNLKPGKPLAFGRIDNCYIFGLPGNPVSTIVTLLLLVKPTLMKLAGANAEPALRVPAKLTQEISHSPGRTEYQRGILHQGDVHQKKRVLSVSGTGDQGSNRLSTFAHANCLIEVPGEASNLPAGTEVQVLPFDGLLS